MAHANEQQRSRVIAGLRSLAEFLEGNPDVPTPSWASMMVFPANGTEHEMRKEVDRIAALIGTKIDDRTAEHGHYTATRNFGPLEYRAVFIPADSRKYQDAKDSYSDNVIPNTREGA